MRTPTLWCLAASLAGLAALASPSDAGGGPPSRPAFAALDRIDHPLVRAMLGEWSVSSKGPMGEQAARASFRLAAGGTALLHDYEGTGAIAYAGHGVIRVTDGGRTMTAWWFDSHAPEPQKLSGPLSEDRAELYGSSAAGPLTLTWKRVEGGLDFTLKNGETTVLDDRYRRPGK